MYKIVSGGSKYLYYILSLIHLDRLSVCLAYCTENLRNMTIHLFIYLFIKNDFMSQQASMKTN